LKKLFFIVSYCFSATLYGAEHSCTVSTNPSYVQTQLLEKFSITPSAQQTVMFTECNRETQTPEIYVTLDDKIAPITLYYRLSFSSGGSASLHCINTNSVNKLTLFKEKWCQTPYLTKSCHLVEHPQTHERHSVCDDDMETLKKQCLASDFSENQNHTLCLENNSGGGFQKTTFIPFKKKSSP
jgi:hypothetical protein